jgi:hypothetical protein
MVHSSFKQLRIDSLITPTPEPGTIGLGVVGLLVLGVCRLVRRRRSRGAKIARYGTKSNPERWSKSAGSSLLIYEMPDWARRWALV